MMSKGEDNLAVHINHINRVTELLQGASDDLDAIGGMPVSDVETLYGRYKK